MPISRTTKTAALAVLAASLLTLSATTASAATATAATTTQCEGAFHGDPRLGPRTLPKVWESPVGPQVFAYQRTGLQSTTDFLAKYWDPTANSSKGGWRYPPQDGYLTYPTGTLAKWTRQLSIDTELDRYGSEWGTFLAPAGTPYTSRAIPPQNLDTYDQAFPCNYHKYKVTKPFKVDEGLIAPWFNQLGLGVQDQLDRTLLPGEGQLNITWLLTNGYLTRTTT